MSSEDVGAEITEEGLLTAIMNLHHTIPTDVNNFNLPGMPKPPNGFRGIRMKNSSLERWLSICSDDLTP